jgi:hypothetical protein
MAFEGNQNGVALKNPKVRQKAYKLFCEHLAQGKSVKSWYYEDGDDLCCWETMVSYIQKYPLEFHPIHKKISETKGYQYWEDVVANSAIGVNPNANTASLQMIMRNKYGWDKQDHNSDKAVNVNVTNYSQEKTD